MPQRLVLLVIAALLTVPGVWAQPVDATSFSLVTLQSSARGAALGGATAALPARSVSAFLENPANLGPRVHNELGLSLLNHVSSLKTGAFSYGRHYQGLGSFGATVRFLGWGDVTRADASGQEFGTFTAGEFAVSLGAARTLTPHVTYGGSVHWLRSSIDGQAASALALDLGILRYDPESRLGLSASIHNVGVVLSSLGSTRDRLPVDLRVGLSKRLRHLPLLISLTAWDLTDLKGDSDSDTALDNLFYHLRLGGEFQFSDAFQVRFGYDHRQHNALKIKSRLDLAGVSFGAGIKVRKVGVDYAFNSWSSLGGLHRFTVTTAL